jgi:hypothetical protein
MCYTSTSSLDPSHIFIILRALFIRTWYKILFYNFQYEFDISSKNIKHNGDENTVSLIQINPINFFICSNLMLTTCHKTSHLFPNPQHQSLQNQPKLSMDILFIKYFFKRRKIIWCDRMVILFFGVSQNYH